jgi:hypothetical protein
LINDSAAFGQEAVSFVKLLSDLCVEPDRLHGANLKACGQDGVNDFSGLSLFDDVWLDDTKGAILLVWF